MRSQQSVHLCLPFWQPESIDRSLLIVPYRTLILLWAKGRHCACNDVFRYVRGKLPPSPITDGLYPIESRGVVVEQRNAFIRRVAEGNGLEAFHDLVIAAEQLVYREVRREHASLDAEG